MARLVMIIGFVVLAGMLLRAFMDQTRNRDTFRPRKAGTRAGNLQPTTFLMPRAELAGVRDGFSAEPIDPDRALMRCPACQSVYHADSVKTLERENDGQCVSCKGRVFDPVQVVG